MTISDFLTIIAIFTGPIVAVQLTRHLDKKKEIRERKLQVFKTLMATRQYTISYDHVLTLNKIDLEFNGNNKNEKEVINAWKAYLDSLSTKSESSEFLFTKRTELLVELLHKMAIVLDYDFDKTHIKNSSYAPIAHVDIEDQDRAIRKGIIEILDGKKEIPMHIKNWPDGM